MKKNIAATNGVVAVIIALAFGLCRIEAGTYSTDFNSGVPPAGMTLFGTALTYDDTSGGITNSGVLKLTDTTASQGGGAIIDDFDSGAPIGGFDATFQLYIGSGNGADGMSFFVGDFADGAYSEEGPGTINGLTICFDVFNNGGTPAEAPAIDVKWNNVVLVHRLVGADSATTGASPIGTATTIRTQATQGGAAVYVPVKIHADTDGTLDLVFNNVVVFTNLPVFHPITNLTINPTAGNARFGFGARTGNSFDNHWVDNLNITTVPPDANSGQPYARSIQQVSLANATTGGLASAVAGAVVEFQEQTFTVNTNAALTMTYNGAAVTPTVTQVNGVTRIAYLGPGGILPVNRGTVALTYSTTSSPPKTNTFSYSFVVGPATALPGGYGLASVDTSKPGFRVKVNQMAVSRNPATGIAANAERQLAGDYVDPTTGLPYDNTADLSATNEPGYFVIPGVWNVNGGDGGGVGNFPNDDPVPGIASGSTADRYVVSIETILDLKAGPYRFGVNSDDGFRLAIGRGPGDVAGLQLGRVDADRGATDTIMDVVIPADGFYPVRLMWWESGGGSSCEFFSQDIATGAKTLINDPTNALAIKAYRGSTVTPPYISRAIPTVDYRDAFADQDLLIDITDGASPLSGTPILRINNVDQTITTGKVGNVTTIRRASSLSNLLPSGANNVTLIYSYASGGSTVNLTNTWSYTVPAYTWPIPAANKVQDPGTQVSGSGFHVRAARQMDRSGDANQGNGGRHTGNNMPGPEIELNDGYINPTNNLPFANLIGTTGQNPDGSYDVSDVLNFNNAASAGGPAANAGIFNLDTQVPGLPGTGTSNFGLDNSVHEFITYLDLKAGVHIFGLNVDDGWICTSAPNPRDTLGTLVGFRNAPGGQGGNPLVNPNAAFSVIVPEDGTYPFRILFWEGGGGVNMEFLEVDRQTGTQILINDVSGVTPSVVGNSGQTVSAITAHNTYTGPVKPWVKFSVYPLPYIGVTSPLVNGGAAVTLWQNRNPQVAPGPIAVKQPFLNGSWNSGEIQAATGQRPFGDAVGAVIADLGTGTVGMVLDGASVTPTVTDIPSSTDKLVMYTPNPPLASTSNHIAGLVYAGTTNYWLFNVIAFTNVSAADILPSSAADPNAVGFHVKTFQATNGQPNTAARAELQIAGLTNNVAIAGTNADGSYTVRGIVNWNVQKNPGNTTGEIGNFQPLLTGTPDDPVPGIPGTGLTGTARFENIAAEIFAYLDLPAGYQKFGVNGDDGWKVQVGTPGQTNGTVLFTIDRGAGAQDIPFAFIMPQAGLVPVRLVWYQGGGGGNLEFFTYGANGTKIPVNDRNNPNSVKAYYSVAGTPQLKFTSATLASGSLTINWSVPSGTARLQQATVLTGSPGDWSDVNGVTGTTYSTQTTGAQKFYRLASP